MVDGAASITMASPASPSAFHSPATPMAAMEVPTEAMGDDGDTMEVCSERVTPPPEPVGEKRTYRRRSVAGISEVVNALGETDAGSAAGFCWLFWFWRITSWLWLTAFGSPAAQECRVLPPFLLD